MREPANDLTVIADDRKAVVVAGGESHHGVLERVGRVQRCSVARERGGEPGLPAVLADGALEVDRGDDADQPPGRIGDRQRIRALEQRTAGRALTVADRP